MGVVSDDEQTGQGVAWNAKDRGIGTDATPAGKA